MSPVDYHALTHRPKAQGGTDPIDLTPDIPWARRSRPFTEANQLVSSGSFVDLDVTVDHNMGAGESGAAWFQPETTGGTPNGIEVLQNSFVLITVSVYWFDVVNATWFPWITHGGGGTWIYYPQFAGQNVTDTAGTFCFHRRCSAGDTIEAGVWQNSGGNRNIDAGFLEVAVLGTWTGDSPSVLDPQT